MNTEILEKDFLSCGPSGFFFYFMREVCCPARLLSFQGISAVLTLKQFLDRTTKNLPSYSVVVLLSFTYLNPVLKSE